MISRVCGDYNEMLHLVEPTHNERFMALLGSTIRHGGEAQASSMSCR